MHYFLAAGASLLSGLCWYLGNGLSGEYWYLVWFAPVFSLITTYYFSPKVSFWLAFGSYFLGRLSWFAYLHTVVSFLPAIAITLALPYVYARIVVKSGNVVLTNNSWLTVFAYPVLWTAFEYLLFLLSPDGSATSLAYSQAGVLPLIQVASLTGISGITFLISLAPSLIAVCWFTFERKRKWFTALTVLAAVLFAFSFVFGSYRINHRSVSEERSIKTGLVAMQRRLHYNSEQKTISQIKSVTETYAREISKLAGIGAKVVLLPETVIQLTKQNEQSVISVFSKTAKENRIYIIAGFTNYLQAQARNSALIFDSNGNIANRYDKVHLVAGHERQFAPGSKPGTFQIGSLNAGIAICKDLDFPRYIREYGKEKIDLLFVPAYDFVVDDWMHSRMAILRGVENGFAIIRTARDGRLTISNYLGEALFERDNSSGEKTNLLGTVSSFHKETLFSIAGDWLGAVSLIIVLIYAFRNSKSVGK
ncbi:nitrilase-related carbon-nitrogen hydrolase [Dyadobacter psychrotolerans]|nr:nitrilase-related carbon-nitrogen hydrolase [Dyadobacter psychrotolerans]